MTQSINGRSKWFEQPTAIIDKMCPLGTHDTGLFILIRQTYQTALCLHQTAHTIGISACQTWVKAHLVVSIPGIKALDLGSLTAAGKFCRHIYQSLRALWLLSFDGQFIHFKLFHCLVLLFEIHSYTHLSHYFLTQDLLHGIAPALPFFLSLAFRHFRLINLARS